MSRLAIDLFIVAYLLFALTWPFLSQAWPAGRRVLRGYGLDFRWDMVVRPLGTPQVADVYVEVGHPDGRVARERLPVSGAVLHYLCSIVADDARYADHLLRAYAEHRARRAQDPPARLRLVAVWRNPTASGDPDLGPSCLAERPPS
jgi:hypothetical protein